MKRTWQAVGVFAGAAGLVVGGMGLAGATGDDPAPAKNKESSSAHLAAVLPEPSTGQTVFTPVTPCRIVDTRASGKIGAAGRSFYVGGTANFPAQGGTSGGCGIPVGASAVAANLVAVNATAGGFLKAFPAASAAPSASVLNYGTSALANELPLSVRPGAATGLTVTASTPTNVLIDVTGYYGPQIAGYVNSDGTLYSRTSAITGITHPVTGTYVLTLDRNVNACAASVTPFGVNNYASASTSESTVEVKTWSLVSGTVTASDRYFNVAITC